MLLGIDIGNTNIVIGVFEGDELIHNWRIASDLQRSSDEYGLIFRQLLEIHGLGYEDVDDVIISSVVPKLTHTIPAVCSRYIGKEPMMVGVGTRTGINIRYDNPKEVGGDRIVNSVAAYELYGGPIVVVDMGTAISFDVIDEKGHYQGGAIAPGIGIASEALFTRTSKLPKVDLIDPVVAIGRTTVQSMQSGIVYGYIALIDGILEKIAEEMEIPIDQLNVVSTGGYTRLIAQNSKYIVEIDPELTLKGLKIIYDKNS